MKFARIVLLIVLPYHFFSQCNTCGNGIIDAGETSLNCPKDVAHGVTCASPCGQPTAFETTTGSRVELDFVGTTSFSSAGLPTGWTFASGPTPSTAGTLAAAGTDAYGAKAGLIQPNCAGSCVATNGFCIGNIANSQAVGSGGTNGKLGANFDGRANVAANLSYAVLRGQGNPTLVSQLFNNASVDGFKIQFWLSASESSCGQTNGWGSCVGNTSFLDFSSDGGTTWVQIMQMNTSSTNSDMCTNNASNTLWLAEGKWGRVCLTVFRSSSAAGNFYPAAKSTTAASGMLLDNRWFVTNFKYRIRYSQTASCTSGISTTNPGRYLAIDYPVFTSGNEMIPCGISFSNMCGYGADNNDDGVGSSSSTTSSTAFGTVKRSVNHAERGVEVLTSQTSAYASQNLTGSTFATNFDLCNAEGGDAQCIDWRTNNNFYTSVYECIADWEAASATGINVQYFKGTTPQSTGMSKVTAAGKTALIGWRYSANRIVSCGSTSDLNPGCNGYSFLSGSLPTQFSRGFYALATNGLGEAWSFYGATSCSHYFNGPFFSPVSEPATTTGSGNYVVCNNGIPVFTGIVNYCSNSAGFSGTPQLTITGPNGFLETIASGDTGVVQITDIGDYQIEATVPNNPARCLNCERSVCVSVTAADLDACNSVLPIELINFDATCVNNTINLEWCTATEKNNHYFTLEQSGNGTDFVSIAKVYGNGTTAIKHCYKATVNAIEGFNYFRLVQTDYSNVSEIHKTISIDPCSKTGNSVTVLNDGTRSINVIFNSETSENLKLYVHNTFGETIEVKTIDIQKGANQLLIHLNNVLTGVYYLSVSTADTLLTSKKIVITNP